MTYRDQLREAMALVAAEPRAIFLGQAVADQGTAMSTTFDQVPRAQLLELPVFEDCQLGMSIGLALAGDLPVSVFPRWSFLLLAANQLVHHLDKLPLMSDYRPKVLIRTAVPTDHPLDPGPQHMGDFGHAFRSMLKTVRIFHLQQADRIIPEYRRALEWPGSTILVEYTGKYDEN